MNTRIRNYWESVKKNFVSDEIFWQNEIKANLLVAKTLILCAVVLVVCWALVRMDVFDVHQGKMDSLTIYALLELIVPALICKHFKGERRWLKYLMLVEMVIVLARIDSVLTYDVMLIILIPIVLSCRYYSASLTKQISILTTILFAISSFCGAYFEIGQMNKNFFAEDKLVYTRHIMVQVFLPRWIIVLLIASVCVEIAKIGKEMVEKQHKITMNHARVETELDMAKKIQERALPIVHVTTDEDGEYIDLAAQMIPAKEVGGDFYDFLHIDSTHLALMMADVSGKGVPAALFMMVSKLLLDNNLAGATSPAKVLTEVNHQLCEKNLEEMFVTVWLAILDLETGHVVASNAGHEYPIICKAGGDFEIFKDKHGLVLGGMDGLRYKDYEFELGIGDTLFVYTDGVAEANNSNNELFGLDRTLASLNSHKGDTMEQLIKNVKSDIDVFAGDAPQFDDTTMLALKLKKLYQREGVTISMGLVRSREAVEKAQKYVTDILREHAIDDSLEARILNTVEEIFGNILGNNSATFADIYCVVDENFFDIKIKDNGLPYDFKEKTKEETDSLLGKCTTTYQCEKGYNLVSMKWEL